MGRCWVSTWSCWAWSCWAWSCLGHGFFARKLLLVLYWGLPVRGPMTAPIAWMSGPATPHVAMFVEFCVELCLTFADGANGSLHADCASPLVACLPAPVFLRL